MSSTSSRESSSSIKVVARFRPQNASENAKGGEAIVDFVGDNTIVLGSKELDGSFTFDRVFGMNSEQSDVFEYSIRSTVDDILNGYNGTVFAYGQTGSGKSFTMMGPTIDGNLRGIIPRIIEQIFASILQSPAEIEYTVRVSYMEIYMERIKDLLRPANDNLPIHEDKLKGVYVKGLREIYVSSVDEVYEVMREGAAARAVASTNMNMESSRSHSIFAVAISQKNTETGSSKSGQLFLVDLAGSEKVGKTGASGQVLEEAKKINKSLSALGMVINALTDGKSTHVPYRDSKLTRILQESLGGNSRTTLIVNCSPSSYNDQETLSTLRFGVRAKNIKNKPKINAELSPAELKIQLRKAQAQNATYAQYIASIEKELGLWRSGEQVAKEKWAHILPTLSEKGLSTPKRNGSDRSGSATPRTDADELEDRMQKENEMEDRLAEKEDAIMKLEQENAALRVTEAEATKDRESQWEELAKMKQEFEKLQFESKETTIAMDELKELHAEATAELEAARRQLFDATTESQRMKDRQEERKRQKREKVLAMTAEYKYFKLAESDEGNIVEDNDGRRSCLDAALNILEKHESVDDVTVVDTKALHQYLVESREFITKTEGLLDGCIEEIETSAERREALEKIVADAVAGVTADGADTKQQSVLAKMLADTKRDLITVLEDNKRLRKTIAATDSVSSSSSSTIASPTASSMSSISSRSPAADNERPATPVREHATKIVHSPTKDRYQTLKEQQSEFEEMKRSLMRDLQSRCERVVELEISLDELREQYNFVMQAAKTSKGQQKRMMFLERNLEQLTQVQRALVDQNAELKREVAAAERKVRARNERIAGLEELLHNSQERLVAEAQSFETRLTLLRSRLEDVSAFRKIADGDQQLEGQRIVKPLRGGGGAASGRSPLEYFRGGGVENSPESGSPGMAGSRRTSWFHRT
ncbi:P-loop containing nucleoside triphosphate hydrolase protein [Limtongia smithiae]|uniref:P-loop containing nucleoside triphosphate hydrolase protein n=1 Tax=Limtongia smithiae TaxID=1125753 RepID=UPI0034CD19B7